MAASFPVSLSARSATRSCRMKWRSGWRRRWRALCRGPHGLTRPGPARAKNASSPARRTAPLTRTGAAPERLGSPGTLNSPHSAAAASGAASAATKRSAPVESDQPQTPSAIRAASSSRNRNARLAGCEPMADLTGSLLICQWIAGEQAPRQRAGAPLACCRTPACRDGSQTFGARSRRLTEIRYCGSTSFAWARLLLSTDSLGQPRKATTNAASAPIPATVRTWFHRVQLTK
jgi:hypothetical protein